MGDPIARVQNPYPKNVVEFVRNLPKTEMSKSDFRKYMENCKWGADKFFTSYYQICCQVGLYYEDSNDIYHPRFTRDITEEEALKYLKFWFSRYYIPNPYTRGFDNLEKPILVEYSIFNYLKNNRETSIETVCSNLFKENIGNPDIFINAINTFSNLIKVENKQCFIKEGAEEMEINNSRDDRKAFFENFNHDSSVNSSKIDKAQNRIIFGAPGTGKSHKLEEESAAFLSQTPTQLDLFNIHLNNCKVNGDYVKFGMIHSAELKDMTVQEISDKYNRKGAYLIKKGAVLCNNLTVSSIEELPQEVEESIKSIPHGKKESKGLEIGYNYCYCLEGASKDSLISDYGAEPTVADWIMYGVEAAKSKIDKVTETQVSFMERVTFHPNYSYAQFVGAYKPKSDFVEIDGRSQKEISYEYVPGPFMRVYVNAINNPDKKFLLLIEEINRANVAAVFGDVFQLLDRKNGSSQYPVTASEDQKSFLKSVGIEDDKIIIPSNMYIWATMNSADQGVLPMDAAFKRRWDFEYLGIDDNQAQISTYRVPFTRNGSKTINWNDFRVKLNEKLAVELKINEDKQLGPFFMNENSLKNAALNPDKFVRLFESKVLMYLFEDVVKMNPKKLFSNCGEDLRYSKICEQWELNGPAIFNIDCEVSTSEVASE